MLYKIIFRKTTINLNQMQEKREITLPIFILLPELRIISSTYQSDIDIF